MNKIILKSVVALAAVATVAPILATTASAAEANYSTSSNLEFEVGTKKIVPIDPENPDITVDPVKPDGSTPTDPVVVTPGLTIDFASSLAFGKQEISTNDKTYFAHPQKYTNNSKNEGEGITPDYVQVTDIRGNFAGWKLSVALDGQFRQAGTDVSVTKEDDKAPLGTYLTGAELKFTKGTTDGTVKAAKPSTVTADLTLSDQEQVIMGSKATEGMGTWTYALGGKADYDEKALDPKAIAEHGPISLSIPGETAKKAVGYETNLIWKLSDTPIN